MEFEDLKLAAYLNEAGDDPAAAADVLSKHNIKNVCLRRVWGRDIVKVNDDAWSLVKNILDQHSISVMMLASSVGDVPTQKLGDQQDTLNKAILICQYFDCPALQVSLGNAVKSDMNQQYTRRWMDIVADRCLTANIQPVFEINYQHCIHSPAELAKLLQGHRSWAILYDPAVLIMKRKISPFTKYWTLLKNRVGYLDVHDYNTGSGPCPAGYGKAQIDLTVNDAVISGFAGWYCLEHGMGRRYGSINDKGTVFEHALDAFKALFLRLEMGPVQVQKHIKWYQK